MEATTALATAPPVENGEQSTNNAVALIDFKAAAAVLHNNTIRADKADALGEVILLDIAMNGNKLNPELDKRCLAYLSNCSSASKEMNAGRVPFTRRMDEIIGMYTSLENRLSNKKAGTKAFDIQAHRDKYALELQQEELKRQADEKAKADKAQEAITIATEAERRLQYAFSKLIETSIQGLSEKFYSFKLLTFDAETELFKDEWLEFTPGDYTKLCCYIGPIACAHHTLDEVENIVAAVTLDRFSEFNVAFETAIIEGRNNLVERIPTRKAELQQYADADAATKKELEAEQQRKREDEAEQLRQQTEQRNQTVESNITQQQESASLDAMFDTVTAMVPSVARPASRDGFTIEILDSQALPLIFSFWWEQEGAKLPVADARKVSLDKMVAFCEAAAKKYNAKIESEFLRYVPKAKAINRK